MGGKGQERERDGRGMHELTFLHFFCLDELLWVGLRQAIIENMKIKQDLFAFLDKKAP